MAEETDKAENGNKNVSNGEQFVKRVAASGVILKFKVGKYGTLPSSSNVISDVNGISSSQSAKIYSTENVTSGISLTGNQQYSASGKRYNGIGEHKCDQCGKIFLGMDAFYGHKGSHRREDYKLIRMFLQQTSTSEAKNEQQRSVRETSGATRIEISDEVILVWEASLGLLKLHKVHGNSSSSCDKQTWNYWCNKCNQRFPTGQSLGGHKRKHWFEKHRMMPATEDAPQSVPVLPLDEDMQSTDNDLNDLDDDAINPAYDAVQPLQAKNVANETGLASGAEIDAVPPPAVGIPVERFVPELNKLPHEANTGGADETIEDGMMYY